MTRFMNAVRSTSLVSALLVSAGCAGAGALGDILGGPMGGGGGGGGGGTGQVTAQVQALDQRAQRIQIRTQDGRTGVVSYDQRTRLVYQQQEYPVTGLEAGDVINMRVQQDQRGNLYTDYIVVVQNVRDPSGTGTTGAGGTYGTQLQRIDGTVLAVDQSRGAFQLRLRSGQVVVVTMPYNPPATERSRFQQLRQDQFISVQGRLISQDRFELERFL
ncbi:hypothetical protein BH23GEM5_BH23GEM5_17370 [soil metagenome]